MAVLRSWTFKWVMLLVIALGLVVAVIPQKNQAAVAPATESQTEVAADAYAATASAGLAFSLPAASTHKKLVFAHYWPPEPISFDNAAPSNDYTSQYLNPTGEDGKHFDTGGLQRDRTVGRNPSSATGDVALSIPNATPVANGAAIGDTQLVVKQWMIDDMKSEIARARAAGIDGFALNLFDLTNLNRDNGPRQMAMLRAASQTGFKIMLQPDMSVMASAEYCGGDVRSQYASTVDGQYRCAPTAKRMAKNLKTFIDTAGSSIYRIDGKVVISPFVSDQDGAAGRDYWRRALSELSAYGAGYSAAMYPVFVYPTTAMVNSYAPISVGAGFWGSRSPNAIAECGKLAKMVKGTAALGSATKKLKWMQSVAVQDARPKSADYREASNSRALQASWDRATFGQVGSWVGKKVTRTKDAAADMVLLTTWNDYTESTSFAPSAVNGWSVLDINAYYMTKFQTGSYPKITRNAVYVSHRVQATGAKPSMANQKYTDSQGKVHIYNQFQSYNGSKAGKKPAEGSASNKVEVLTMLKKAAKVKVVIGSKTYTYTAPAGVSVKAFSLRSGYVKAQLLSGKKAVATAATGDKVTTQRTEDLSYHFASSLR